MALLKFWYTALQVFSNLLPIDVCLCEAVRCNVLNKTVSKIFFITFLYLVPFPHGFFFSECQAVPNPARDDPGGGGYSGQPDLQLGCRPGIVMKDNLKKLGKGGE